MTPVLAFEEMRLVLELLAALLVFLIPFAQRKESFALKSVGGYIFLTLASLLYFAIFKEKENPAHSYFTGIWYPLFVILSMFYGKFCFVISWCDAIFMSISAFATQNVVYVFINQYIARYLYPNLRNHLFFYILISLLFCIILYGIIYKIFTKPLSSCEGKLFDDTPANIGFYTFMFILMMSTLLHFQNLFENFYNHFFLTSCIMGITFCIFLLAIEYSILRSRAIYKENARLEQFLSNTATHYNMSKESIEIINRKCHDLKHQLKILSQTSDEERNTYIEEARKDIMFYQQLVHSDNEVINTILAEKGLYCSEHDISLTCSVDDANLDFIRVADLYAILGNAIDNAIEYVTTFEEPQMRVINFRISQKKQFVSIQINNPYTGPSIASNSLPKTTKGDDSVHGFGLKSIRHLAKQYNGWMEIDTSDGMFTLQLTFCLS